MSDALPSVIAIAVVEHEGRFLVGVRPAGVPLAGFWEFPGGKVEPGERVEDTVVRECWEETGLPIRVCGVYPDQVQRYDEGTVHLHFFRCQPLVPVATPRSPFCWVPQEELAKLKFPAGNGPLLRHLLSK